MNNTQTQINPTVIQQNLIQTSIDMNSINSSSNKAYRSSKSRSSRHKDGRNKASRDRYKIPNKLSRRSRSRDRDRKLKERRHDKKDKKEHKNRKERKELSRRNNGIRDRKRRRSLSNNRDKKSKHLNEDLRRKRRKLNNSIQPNTINTNESNTIQSIQPPNNTNTNNNNNVTFDIKINDNINAVKDIKNLVSNSKNNTNIDMKNIPAVLQDKNIVTPKTFSQNGTNGNVKNVTIHRKSNKPKRAHNSNSDASSTSSYSDASTNHMDQSDSDSDTASSQSYSNSDSDYTSDSSSSEDNKEENIVNKPEKIKKKSQRDRRSRHHHRRRDRSRHRRDRRRDRDRNRHRDRKKLRKDRGRTPNWLDHQAKEWFKAMEMLTKFNHRKNYRDKFLSVFEDAVYNKFEHFWHNKAVPTTQDLKQLESIFEKLYFEHFNSIRQVREYQQNMQRQIPTHPPKNNNPVIAQPVPKQPVIMHINPPQTGGNIVSSYSQANANKNKMAQTGGGGGGGPTTNKINNDLNANNLLSMLNLGDDYTQNIQNIQALLAMTSQQQQQNERRTLRVPSRLQQNNNMQTHSNASPMPIVTIKSINNNVQTVTVPGAVQANVMPITLQPPTIRKPAALRQVVKNESPLPAEIMVNNPQIIVHSTVGSNNNVPLMPPPNQTQHVNVNVNMDNTHMNEQELPTPEPIIITHKTVAPPPIATTEEKCMEIPKEDIKDNRESSHSVSPVEVMPSPSAPVSNKNNDIEMNGEVLDNDDDDDIERTDEQICEALNIPPPPKDPRVEMGENDNDNDNEMNVDINIHDDSMSDENISVISDVVTEDDIIITPQGNNSKKGSDNDSTNSMSPEVQIEKSRISNSKHITTQNVGNDDDEDIDFEQTLNNISDFLAIDNNINTTNVISDITTDININNETTATETVTVPPVTVLETVQESVPECKTNSTNESKVAAQLGIETSWLFSDDDLENTNLPGITTVNIPKPTINNETQTNPYKGDKAPTHYIPPPSYYNPPAPGQDVDRRQLRRKNNTNTIQPPTNNINPSVPTAPSVPSQLQPRRRAVRRRKPNQNNMSNGDDTMNVLDVNKPKQRPAAKKRGFFNRTRTNTIHRNTNNNINTIGNAFASVPAPGPISTNHMPKSQSPTIIAGFDMSEANQPKPRKPAPKSFTRINNNLIPKHNNTNTLPNGIRDRKRPTPPITNISRQSQKSSSSSKLLSRKINVPTAVNNNKRIIRKRNKNLIPKTKDTKMIDLTKAIPISNRIINNKNKIRVIRKQPLKSKSKSNTPNPNMIASTINKSRSNTPIPSHIKKPISKSNMPKKTTREAAKRPRNIAANMGPSKGRHYQDLGPKLDAPPTDISALFDEKPKKKKVIEDNTPVIANNPKPHSSKKPTTSVPSRTNNYYDPRGPPPSHYPHGHGPPPNNYYPPNHGPPPNGYYQPPPPSYPYGPPPGYYGPPGGYYPPPPHGHYAPPYGPPPHMGGNNIGGGGGVRMPEPNNNGTDNNGIKYKKIAKYRDNVFFPDEYKKWNGQEYMDYIDNSIHERTKLLLFLDIDHTILHSTRDKRGLNYLNHKIFGNDIFEINFPNQYNATYYIKFRPSFRKLISELYPLFDFVLYTMGSRSYAEQVAMIIDEHFRQYIPKNNTRDRNANNRHNKTFIIGNRIICREDHVNISDKDYKKNILQFAPVKTEWCMIIDDVPEVWMNRDDIHRVPKYLFWPNPDKTAPGTNHKHTSDSSEEITNNKINIWSKNSITKWNDDKSLLKQEKDTVLLQCIELCKCVHECYYSKYTPTNTINVSTINIFNIIRNIVMKDASLVFTGVFPQKNAKNDFHWKLAELFGANVSEQITNKTTHLIGKDSKTSKIQQAIKDGKIEIVHVNWLYQTLFNFGLADCNKFRMFKNGDDKHTPTMHCHVKVKSKRELVSMYQNNST